MHVYFSMGLLQKVWLLRSLCLLLHLQQFSNNNLKSSYVTSFLTCCSNDVCIFLSKALSLFGEVSHHRKQSSQVEVEENFWVCVQERLQCLVQHSDVLGLVVIWGNETALHCVSYGLEHQVGVI